MKRHKKRHFRKTDKQGLHAKKYQDMAIRSLDGTQKEKQRSGSTRIPEKKSIPSAQPVNKSHKDDAIEGNAIAIEMIDSSGVDSTPRAVEDPHIKNSDQGDSARKTGAKEVPISTNTVGNQALNTSSVHQQTQPNPQSSHQGRESTSLNAPDLDSIEVLAEESKQGTNNVNLETSRIRTQQEGDYKGKEDEERLRKDSQFNSTPPLMHSIPWFQAADAWTRQCVEFTDNAFMLMEYWLDLFSATWLGKDKRDRLRTQ